MDQLRCMNRKDESWNFLEAEAQSEVRRRILFYNSSILNVLFS